MPHQLSDSLLSSLVKVNLFKSASSSSSSSQAHRVHFVPDVFHSEGRRNSCRNGSSGMKSRKQADNVVSMGEEHKNVVPGVIADVFPKYAADNANLETVADEFSPPDAGFMCATPTNVNVEQRDMFGFGGEAVNVDKVYSCQAVVEVEEATAMDDEQLIF